jgi:hypothetical protein
MTKPLKGILIDPKARTVSWIELPGDADAEAMAKLVNGEYFSAFILRKPVEADPGVVLYVDEDGPARPGQAFWAFDVRPLEIYAGKGVIAAIDTDGLMTWGVATPEEIAKRVQWHDQIEEEPHASISDRPGGQGSTVH